MRCAWILMAAVAGCYDPQFQVGLPCSPAGDCPAGQLCAADGTCQLMEVTSDAQPSPYDGAPGDPDAMPIPLESWFVSFQHPTLARASDVATVGGGFALIGSGDVVALDPLGQIRWQRDIGAGTAAVAGVTGGMIVAGATGQVMSAVKLDHDGDIQWQTSYAYQSTSTANAVVPLANSDDVVLIGYSRTDAEVFTAWLVRIDPSGDVVWQKGFNLTGGIFLSGGAATSDGGVVAIGNSGGQPDERDLLVFKVDGNGDLVWQKRVDGGDNDWGDSASEGPNGEVVLTGGTWSNSFGSADMWLIRLDVDGELISQHRIGTTAFDSGERVFASGPGGALLVGRSGDGSETDLYVVEVKNNAVTNQLLVGSSAWDYGGGAAYGHGGLVVFGDTDAFGDSFGFFAAAVLLPDGLDPGCTLGTAAAGQMATSNATISDIALTASTTTATVSDLDVGITDAAIGITAECE